MGTLPQLEVPVRQVALSHAKIQHQCDNILPHIANKSGHQTRQVGSMVPPVIVIASIIRGVTRDRFESDIRSKCLRYICINSKLPNWLKFKRGLTKNL